MQKAANGGVFCRTYVRARRRRASWFGTLAVAGLLASCRTEPVGPSRALKLTPEPAKSGQVTPAGTAAAPAFYGSQGKAIVRAIRGGKALYSDSYSRSDSRRRKLQIGHRLVAGNAVLSDDAATVDLHLGANGPFVRVLPGTVLSLEQLQFRSFDGERTAIATKLRLEQGRILAAVRKLEAGSVYEIATPNGLYRARGTAFELSADGRLVVLEGVVERARDGGPLLVKSGEALDGQSGAVRPAPPELIGELRRALAMQSN